MESKLFDRIIDIELTETSGRVLTIACPRKGRKPAIEVSGNFFANTVQNASLKMTNFYPDKPLNAGNEDGAVYSWIKIYAGYANGDTTVIEGQAFVSYTESPGPDGVTVITFFTGPLDPLKNVVLNANWKENTSINSVVDDICSKLSQGSSIKIERKSYVSDNVKVGEGGLSVSSNFAEIAAKLSKVYNLKVYAEGKYIIVCDAELGKTDEYTLNFVTSIKKSGAGYTIIAPWIPGIRQNDTVILDAKYYTVENYGGIAVKFGKRFTVITASFEFSTVGDKNTMTLLCVGERAKEDSVRKVKPS